MIATSEDMAPPWERTHSPPTCVLGRSYKTQDMIEDMETRGFLEVGFASSPPAGENSAHLERDEVVVFHEFFFTGLRFPLDPLVVEIFKLFDIYLHQMMPTSFLRLNLYMWLMKT